MTCGTLKRVLPTWAARTAIATLGSGLIYALIEPHRIALRRYDVALPDLPASCEGLRMVQLSDLHISAMTSARFLRRVVQIANTEQPDVIVLTGDYVSRRNSYLPLTGARIWARPVMEYAIQMAAEIAHLRAPEGVFAVAGNHDHSRGRFEAIEELLNASGVVTLTNRNILLRGALPLVGLDDVRAGRIDLKSAFAGIDPNAAQIVLSHNPRVTPLLSKRNCLILAGHTHGGQVHLPLTDFRRRPSDMRGSPWFQGWYERGRAQLYVNSGIGSVHFPLRLRCQPEIAVFTLKRRQMKDEW